MKNVKESQQAAQGVTIRTLGNQGGVVPEGAQAVFIGIKTAIVTVIYQPRQQ